MQTEDGAQGTGDDGEAAAGSPLGALPPPKRTGRAA